MILPHLGAIFSKRTLHVLAVQAFPAGLFLKFVHYFLVTETAQFDIYYHVP